MFVNLMAKTQMFNGMMANPDRFGYFCTTDIISVKRSRPSLMKKSIYLWRAILVLYNHVKKTEPKIKCWFTCYLGKILARQIKIVNV